MSRKKSSGKNTGTTFKAVLDSNILYSGILFDGLESDLLDLGYQQKVRLLISEYIRDEIIEVFKRKTLSHSLASKYVRYSKIDVVGEKEIIEYEKFSEYLKESKKVVGDLADRPVFILAKIKTREENTYLVTGDKIFHQPKTKKALKNKVLKTNEILKKIMQH